MAADTMLSEKLWCLLDSLADGEQPFEQVYAEYGARSRSATPDDLQTDLAHLQANGLVSVSDFSLRSAEAQRTPDPAGLPDLAASKGGKQ